jgi:hypothetical protein
MEANGIKDVIELAKNSVTTQIGDEIYAKERMYRIKQVDHVNAIGVTTLRSLAEIIKSNPQGFDLEGAAVVIEEDFKVRLLSKPGEHKERDVFVEVTNPIMKFQFGKDYDSVSFSIAIQALFVKNEESVNLFRTVSSLKIEDGIELSDDGTTTKVTARKGVSSATTATINQKSIVTLKPFRTFAECEQVESPFLLRLSGNKEDGAFVSLFECDGGAWKIKAFETIAKKLVEFGVDLPIFY